MDKYEKNRINWLDSMRGIACIIVVLAHVLSSIPSIGVRVAGCGKIGVWLLFVFSGFWTLYPYIKNKRTFNIGDSICFYINRFFRIYPLYILVIIVVAIIGYLSRGQIVDHFLLREAIGHFWTIPVEVKFYFIVPILLLICTRLKDKLKLVFLGICAIVFVVIFPYTNSIENGIGLRWYLPVFCLGMMLAVLSGWVQKKESIIADGISVLFCIVLISLVPGVRELLFKIKPDGYLQNKYIFISILWLGVLITLFCSKYGKKLLSSCKWLICIGKNSYSIYLIHYIVLQYAREMIENSLIRTMVVLVLSLIVAIVIEQFIEQPMIMIGKKIERGIRIKISERKIYSILGLIVILLAMTECITLEINDAVEVRNIKNTTAEADDLLNDQEQTWRDRLYVPTMVQKCGDTYFIIDCWNSRILYNSQFSTELTEWHTLQDANYLGGHSVAYDGELYVFDNTDMNSLLVYANVNGELKLIQTIEGVDERPHYVCYDAATDRFYVIGSENATLYSFYNNGAGKLQLEKKQRFPELENAYVRSIAVIDGKLYTVSGNSQICEYDIEDDFALINIYPVNSDLCGMNQITKIGDRWLITVNTNASGDLKYTDIIETRSLSELEDKGYRSLYKKMGFVGQPYFITSFDGRYYITEISENKGNGIKSFLWEDDKIVDVRTEFYYDDVWDASKERWKIQTDKYCG